jgi:hypothetical protein
VPASLLTLLLAAGVLTAASGRPRGMVAVLATTWLLVPGAARLPGTGAGQLLIHRLVLVAVVVGLVRAVLLGRIDRRVFAVRGTHLAFVGFLTVALVAGVVLAEPRIPTSSNANTYAALFEQGLFFAVALAAFRATGARQAAVIVTAVAGLLATIAISEGMLSWSYSRWFIKDLPDPSGLLSLSLGTRGPHERVRAAATFALELGWILALLLPLTVATAMAAKGRARLLWAVPGALLVAMVWTWSRSTYAGLAVGLAVLTLGVVVDRPRRAAPLGFLGLVIGALLLQGPLRTTLDLGQTRGEQDVRFQRLPELFDLASERPLGGLGLGGLLVRGFTAVDLSWVNTYATLGVMGVVSLAVLLLTAAHAASRFLLAGPSPTRLVAAGAAAGVIVAPVGLAAYDLLSLRNSTATVWALAALAMTAGEELGVLPVPLNRRAELVPRPAFALGLLGLAGGFALAAAVPTVHSVDATFTTVSPRALAIAERNNPYAGKVLGQTGCLVVDQIDGIDVDCLDRDQIAGGVGSLRIEARSAEDARRDYLVVHDTVARTFPHAVVAVVDGGSGRPTWATTAPFWLFAAGFAAGALLPDRAYRVPEPAGPPGQPAGADP